MKRRTALTDDVLADYVRECADRMRLRDWVIAVSSDPADEPEHGIDQPGADRCATFAGTLGRKHAGIWFNREYLDKATREEIRQTTAHELVHAMLHPCREVVIMLSVLGGKKASDVLLGCYDTSSEYAVDDLGELIAPLLPLPPA